MYWGLFEKVLIQKYRKTKGLKQVKKRKQTKDPNFESYITTTTVIIL